MAKKNKVKVPKQIAGIKLRKGQRKAIGTILGLVESPEVRTAVGSVVGALLAGRAKDKKGAGALH